MTTLADKPAWLAAWHAEHPERVEAGAARAAEQAAQREAQRAARATSTPNRGATPKPRTAPAQRAQAPKAAKAKPAGDMVWSQPLGHDLEEPEPWAWDGGKRREQVLDHNFRPPRVVRSVGWRCCMKCAKPYFSQDVIRQRMCDGCRPTQPPW